MSNTKKIEPLPGMEASAPAPESTPHPIDLAKVQSVYPQVDDRPRVEQAAQRPDAIPDAANDSAFQNANSRSYEAFATLSGLASCISYYYIAMVVKNAWMAISIIAVLAVVAMVCALRSFRLTGSLSPFAVMGVAAATFAFVNIANFVIARLYIHTLGF